MRKYLLTAIFVLFGLISQSQVLITLLLGDYLNSDKVKFGLEGGGNWSNITGMESNKYTRFFNLGFYFDIQLKNQLRLYTGTLVKSNLGLGELQEGDLQFLNMEKYDPKGGKFRQVSSTFVVPAFLKYDFKNHIHVMGGPQFGLMHKAYVEYNYDEDGVEARIRQDNKDMLQKLDAGIGGGLGYTFRKGEGLVLGFKCYHGFVDVYKDKSGTKNNSFNIYACLRIGGPKKEKTE